MSDNIETDINKIMDLIYSKQDDVARTRDCTEPKLVIYIGRADHRDLIAGADRSICQETMAGYPFHIVGEDRYLAVHEE